MSMGSSFTFSAEGGHDPCVLPENEAVSVDDWLLSREQSLSKPHSTFIYQHITHNKSWRHIQIGMSELYCSVFRTANCQFSSVISLLVKRRHSMHVVTELGLQTELNSTNEFS